VRLLAQAQLLQVLAPVQAQAQVQALQLAQAQQLAQTQPQAQPQGRATHPPSCAVRQQPRWAATRTRWGGQPASLLTRHQRCGGDRRRASGLPPRQRQARRYQTYASRWQAREMQRPALLVSVPQQAPQPAAPRVQAQVQARVQARAQGAAQALPW